MYSLFAIVWDVSLSIVWTPKGRSSSTLYIDTWATEQWHGSVYVQCMDSLARDILAKIFVLGGLFGQIYNIYLYH